MVEFVFFDAGETLLGPRPSWSELSVRVLRERGHEVTVDEMRRAWQAAGHHFDRAADAGLTFSTSAEESKTFWTTLYRDLVGELDIDDPELPEALYANFSDASNYGLFPDARPALERLRDRGLRLGVISNFESWLRTLLERLDVHRHFDVLVISGEVGLEKPDARIFELALDRAGVEPERALHVGDSRRFDAEAAIACGMQGVLIDRHGRQVDVDYPRISTLHELEHVITPGLT